MLKDETAVESTNNIKHAVWYSDCGFSTENYAAMECIEHSGNKGTATAVSHRRVRFSKEEVPLGLRDLSGRYGEEYARYMPDFFLTGTALVTVSEKMHDLLVQFDMGDNQFIEVPFFDFDGVTPRPERFWILAVAARKAEIDQENTTIGPEGEYVDGKARYFPNVLMPTDKTDKFLFNFNVAEAGNGQFALPRSVIQGPDLWANPQVSDLLFFSDRLRQAFESTELKIKRKAFYPVVLTEVTAEKTRHHS